MLQSFIGKFWPQFSVYEQTHKWLHKKNVDHFARMELPSTNDKAKEEAFSLSVGVRNYLVDQQTKGRGRGSNTWSNPKSGHSLMMSFSFLMGKPPQPILTPLVGLAVARSLEHSFRLNELSIKAPNDILLSGKKIAGLLVEAVQMGGQNRLIIGLGLNVFASPESIPEAGFLNEQAWVSKKRWDGFLDQLQIELKLSSQEALAPHLSEGQRVELLKFLNRNPNLNAKYDSISPFGDLSSGSQVVSWREL